MRTHLCAHNWSLRTPIGQFIVSTRLLSILRMRDGALCEPALREHFGCQDTVSWRARSRHDPAFASDHCSVLPQSPVCCHGLQLSVNLLPGTIRASMMRLADRLEALVAATPLPEAAPQQNTKHLRELLRCRRKRYSRSFLQTHGSQTIEVLWLKGEGHLALHRED
jgi:hypothetical protein